MFVSISAIGFIYILILYYLFFIIIFIIIIIGHVIPLKQAQLYFCLFGFLRVAYKSVTYKNRVFRLCFSIQVNIE